MITLMMTMMITLMMMMVRSGGRSGASASRKPALLDRTKSWRQAEVTKVVIPAVTSIIILVAAIITILIRQEKRLALEEGLRRPPSQPLPSLRPLSQPPSLRSLPPSSSSSSDFLRPHSGHPRLLCHGTRQLGSRRLARNTSPGLPDRSHGNTSLSDNKRYKDIKIQKIQKIQRFKDSKIQMKGCKLHMISSSYQDPMLLLPATPNR